MEGKGSVREKATEYAERPYTFMLTAEEEGGYTVEVLELPGCMSAGDTADEAMANIRDAMVGWFIAAAEKGQEVPEPLGENDYSGQMRLRIPPSLHRQAAIYADREGVSLNTWLSVAIAEKAGFTKAVTPPGKTSASVPRPRFAQRVRVKIGPQGQQIIVVGGKRH